MLTSASDSSSKTVDELVSAFVKAVKTARDEAGKGGQTDRLVAEFDALAGPERDQVAQALTQLWDAFNERFNGVQGFLCAEFSDRDAYVKQLERAGERMARHSNGVAARYHRATTLMLAYIRAVLQQQSLEARLMEAVYRGRVLARERPPIQSSDKVVRLVSPDPALYLMA
jgi:hypothetical protein